MAQDPARVRAAYDVVAPNYAGRFASELDGKPFERERLDEFAADVRGEGRVCDLGCGPGHVAAYLAQRDVDVFGADLSSGQVEQARRLFPDLEFRVSDMLALDLADASLAGITALYSIVHFTPDQVERAIAEMHRVLAPGGRLMLSFHIGTESIAVDEFLDHRVSIDFMFFSVEQVIGCVRAAGFQDVTVEQRGPYPDVEAQTQRAYVRAGKAAS